MVRILWVTLVAVLVAIAATSCLFKHPPVGDISLSRYRLLASRDSIVQLPCSYNAFSEIRKIGLDTTDLILNVLEDDTSVVYHFYTKSAIDQRDPDGILTLYVGRETFIVLSKSNCAVLKRVTGG